MRSVEKKLKPRVRLNLDLSPNVKSQLEDLQDRTDASSFVEVIRRALSVYDLVVTQEEESGKIVFENPDGTTERIRIL